MFIFTKTDLFTHAGNADDFSFDTERYYAQLAVDYYGSAVRDNSIQDLIQIGREIESGDREF